MPCLNYNAAVLPIRLLKNQQITAAKSGTMLQIANQ